MDRDHFAYMTQATGSEQLGKIYLACKFSTRRGKHIAGKVFKCEL
jgi:hypothetical protein